MAIYPGSAAHSSAHVFGSCKLEYSTDGTSWTNIGLARGVTFVENLEKTTVQADNGPNVVDRIGDQTVDISFNALELYLPTFNALRGIDLLTVTSAVATTDTDVYTTGQFAKGDIIWLQNNGSSSTLPSITKVKSVDTGGSCDTYTSTDDYAVFTDTSEGRNRRGIHLTVAAHGGDFKDTEALKIKYRYGSINARKLSSGGLASLNAKYYRLTNKEMVSGVAKYRYFVVYSGTIEAGLNLAFKSSNEGDSLLECPVSIKARMDSTRTAGDQLFYIEDQRATD